MIHLKVLKSLPWDKVDIEVMLVELHMAGKVFPGTRHEVHLFLDDKGYDYVGTVGKMEQCLAQESRIFLVQVLMISSYRNLSVRINTNLTDKWRWNLKHILLNTLIIKRNFSVFL